MQQNFTQDDVILYIYEELESDRKQAVELAISADPELLKFYQESLLVINQLNTIEEEPASTVINILNEESRSNSLEIH